MKHGKKPRSHVYADLEEHNADIKDIFSELSASGAIVRTARSYDENDGFNYLLDYDDDELKLLLKSA